MKRFANLPALGQLFYHRIYLFYDEPLLFVCRADGGGLYLVESLPSNDNKERWLMVAITSQRLHSLENNGMEIRDAFLRTQEKMFLLWRERGKNHQFAQSCFNSENLTDDLLPLPGEYLDYNSTRN